MKKLASLLLALILVVGSVAACAETLTGEADGFGGKIVAEVTVEDGKITGLTLTGDGETEGIGAAALVPLTDAIVAAGTVEGVEGVSGATWTSNGVFAAVNAAMGVTEEVAEENTENTVSADAIKHGIAIVSTPRLGPGKDANEVPVYSMCDVVAYVVTDAEDRILDLEVDILEIITPNHDVSNEEDNFLAGWPGQSYNSDADGDGVVDGELEETTDIFTEKVGAWMTKRQKGSGYKMNSGTWEAEMDIYEKFFAGKTVAEIRDWEAKMTSDRNGRPITAASENEQDAAKFAALTDAEKAQADAVTGATMSVNDAHGNIIAAIEAAVNNAVVMDGVTSVSKIGLGVLATPRLGPGKDDLEVPCYSFNIVGAGVALDAEGRILGVMSDIMEIITPNHDGAHDNSFPGWPGQSYNNDIDADGKVDEVTEQTEESFVETVAAFQTKRVLGDAYKMNSGTWVQEMSGYEGMMVGMNKEELDAWFAACFSDLNGRALHEGVEKEEDVAKRDAMTDEQKAAIDAVSCATMSLSDAHGDLIGAIDKALEGAKDMCYPTGYYTVYNKTGEIATVTVTDAESGDVYCETEGLEADAVKLVTITGKPGTVLKFAFKTEGGYEASFDTLHIETAPITLLAPDALTGATPISFFAPEA